MPISQTTGTSAGGLSDGHQPDDRQQRDQRHPRRDRTRLERWSQRADEERDQCRARPREVEGAEARDQRLVDRRPAPRTPPHVAEGETEGDEEEALEHERRGVLAREQRHDRHLRDHRAVRLPLHARPGGDLDEVPERQPVLHEELAQQRAPRVVDARQHLVGAGELLRGAILQHEDVAPSIGQAAPHGADDGERGRDPADRGVRNALRRHRGLRRQPPCAQRVELGELRFQLLGALGQHARPRPGLLADVRPGLHERVERGQRRPRLEHLLGLLDPERHPVLERGQLVLDRRHRSDGMARGLEGPHADERALRLRGDVGHGVRLRGLAAGAVGPVAPVGAVAGCASPAGDSCHHQEQDEDPRPPPPPHRRRMVAEHEAVCLHVARGPTVAADHGATRDPDPPRRGLPARGPGASSRPTACVSRPTSCSDRSAGISRQRVSAAATPACRCVRSTACCVTTASICARSPRCSIARSRSTSTSAIACLGASAAERGHQLRSLDAPEFTLPDLDGRPHTLSEHRGRKVLLLAWASW